MAYSCNSGTWDVEAQRSGVEGSITWQFEANVWYIRP